MMDRLHDYAHDLAHHDFSNRETVRRITDEPEMQRTLALRMEDKASGAYRVTREEEVADRKRTDIRFLAVDGSQKAVVEVKMANKWSVTKLENALNSQAWRIAVQIAVQGQLVPWMLAVEARGGSEAEGWVETQVEKCAKIRRERKGMAKQALIKGKQRDFMAFLPMAVPVLEDMVRQVAGEAGVVGGTVARRENEPGLGWHLRQPVAREALGKEWAFTLDCLWTAPHGENYRNEVAHGGLKDREYHGHGVVFAWWTLMKWIHELGRMDEKER